MKRFLNVVWACLVISLFPGFAMFNTIGIASGVLIRDKYPPSWYQILPADKRFVLVMNDEAVLDKETGLVWERSPSNDKKDWDTANEIVRDKIIGSRKGWRLPTIEELTTLVDPSRHNPALPKGHPFINIQSDLYWSATTVVIRLVQFSDGSVVEPHAPPPHLMWAVRGGHGYDFSH